MHVAVICQPRLGFVGLSAARLSTDVRSSSHHPRTYLSKVGRTVNGTGQRLTSSFKRRRTCFFESGLSGGGDPVHLFHDFVTNLEWETSVASSPVRDLISLRGVRPHITFK